MRRLAHGFLIALILGGLLATGALAYAIYEWADGPEFDREAWREARANNSEDLDDLARQAVESGDLIGKTRAEVREMLGPPYEMINADHAWEWDIGWTNDYLGPGDSGVLRIYFDRRTRRSSKATIEP